MKHTCPTCQHELTPTSALTPASAELRCEHCEKTYIKQNICPQCHNELEKLQACGAVSYFCQTCNELKSKSHVIHSLILKAC
ncbi:MAG: zinc ribbon domain-containing protein [Vibrionaceae bacterium]